VNWLFRRKKGRPRATTSTAGLDERTLQELAKAGGNLAMPTEIVNYLYVPDEAGAHAAGPSSSKPDTRWRFDLRRRASNG
jgi:hypothetical protein